MKIYLISVIIWLIILKATDKFTKEMMKNKSDIDYKKYVEGRKIKGELNLGVVSFIPIIRLVVWGVMLFLIFARKEDLDKLFKE